MFQHTAARRRLGGVLLYPVVQPSVSTHSRPKAAGCSSGWHLLRCRRFNTQPPEGGWMNYCLPVHGCLGFQHTAARRRLAKSYTLGNSCLKFQHTAARRRLDLSAACKASSSVVSTHSRPKAAGASLKSLVPSGFAAPISLSSQEKREREYNTAFSVTPAFAIY